MPSLCHHYATIVWGIQPWPASWRFSPKAKVKNWTNSLTVRSWFRQQKRLRHSNSVAKLSKLSKLAKAQTLAKVGQGPTTPVIGKRSIHWSIMIYYDLLNISLTCCGMVPNWQPSEFDALNQDVLKTSQNHPKPLVSWVKCIYLHLEFCDGEANPSPLRRLSLHHQDPGIERLQRSVPRSENHFFV
jgi:hypothetical protein